jgi:hypothetical protein
MKATFFPRGGTHCEECERESIWRETSFMFEVIRQAINPRLNLLECIRNWAKIKAALSESPRKRVLQFQKLLI